MADSILKFVVVLMTLIAVTLALYFRKHIAKRSVVASEVNVAKAQADQITSSDGRREPGFWDSDVGDGKGGGDVGDGGSGGSTGADGD